MNPCCVQWFALPYARRNAWSFPRTAQLVGRFPTANRMSRHQSRYFESSAVGQNEVDSPEPSPEPYRPLGPVESNVYELIPLAEELRATRFVSKVKNPVVTSFFPRNKLDEFSVAVQRGGMAIDRAINILTRPHDLETDKKTLARIIMHLRAALVASKVLSALQQELRLSPDTFLSDEDRTKLEDFIEALRARPPFRGENYLDRDQELVQLVATLREEVKKRQNNKEPKSQPEQTPTPQPVEQCRDTPVTIRRYHSQENGRQIQYKRVIK